jgi:hypothetical protein
MTNGDPITINDFMDRIYTIRSTAVSNTISRTKAAVMKYSVAGLLKSGPFLKHLASIIEGEFENALGKMLDLIDHAKSVDGIEYKDVRDQVFIRARELGEILFRTAEIEKRGGSGDAGKAISSRLSKLPAQVEYRIRQREVGLDPTARSERVHNVTNNTVNAGAIYGVVQQAGAGSQLNATTNLDYSGIEQAATVLMAEIEKSGDFLSDDVRQMRSDIQTIRAQLDSPKPKASYVRDAMQSILSVAEGAIGGALSPGIVVAAQSFGALLA